MYIMGYVYIYIYRYLILCVHNMGIHEQKHGATMEVGLFFFELGLNQWRSLGLMRMYICVKSGCIEWTYNFDR